MSAHLGFGRPLRPALATHEPLVLETDLVDDFRVGDDLSEKFIQLPVSS
jgi:hypothetical protein